MSWPARSVAWASSNTALRKALEVLRSPRARWSTPVLGAVAAAALASLWQAVWPSSYTATARIVVDPSAAGASGAAAEWIATQAQIIGSDRVARRAAVDVGMTPASAGGQSARSNDGTAERLLAHLAVAPSASGGVIAVSYASVDPAFAVQVADGFVAAYDRVSQEIQAAAAAAIRERARARLASLHEDVDQAQRRLEAVDRTVAQRGVSNLAQAVQVARLASTVDWSGLPGEADAEQRSMSLLADRDHAALNGATLERPASAGALEDARLDLQRAREAFAAYQGRLDQFDSERILARPAMTVLNPAGESVRGAASKRAETVELATVGGLIAAWVLGAIARRIDRRVGDAQDLARFSGLAVFGVLHNVDTRSRRVVCASTRRAPVADASVVPALP